MSHRRRPLRLLERYLHGMGSETRRNPFVKKAVRRFGALASRGIQTMPDLISAYPRLPKRDREFAVWAMGIMDDRRGVPPLISIYEAEPKLRGEVATALGTLGGKRAYDFAVRNLRAVLSSEPVNDDNLKAAVIAVVFMPSEHDRLLEDPDESVLLLVDLLRRKALLAWARGEAASGLGHILEHSDRRRRHWRLASQAILNALSDDEPYVRHEAAHAAGDMRLRAARPRLTAMMKRDEGEGGWGTVAREARGALFAVEHGDWPEWWWENEDPDA